MCKERVITWVLVLLDGGGDESQALIDACPAVQEQVVLSALQSAGRGMYHPAVSSSPCKQFKII